MDFENMNIWCFIIPALVGIICGILGYLIGRGSTTEIDNSGELNVWKDKNAKLRADLDACNGKLNVATTAAAVGAVTTATSLTASAPSGTTSAVKVEAPKEATSTFDAAAAKAAYGKTIKLNDLTLVEGIGPKISEMFNNAGITTWKALSETSVAKCQEVLDGGGSRYKVHDPASWPLQAKMCYEGKWAELTKWQSEHNHGRL